MVKTVGCTLLIPVTVTEERSSSVTEKAGLGGDQRFDLGDGRCEGGLAGQLGRRPWPPLGTLAGEHHHRAAIALGHRALVRRFAVGDVAQRL